MSTVPHHLGLIDRVRVDAKTGCWEWTGYVDRQGYGHGRLGTSERRAHRAAYTLEHGPIPEGHHVHHRCENKRCVNPAHLEAVAHGEHLAAHHRFWSKLTWEDVHEIRRLHKEGVTELELAMQFGIGKSQAHNIVANLKWHDPDYQPVRVATCPECDGKFTTTKMHKRFCCRAHRELHGNRRKYRVKHGLDPAFKGRYGKRWAA